MPFGSQLDLRSKVSDPRQKTLHRLCVAIRDDRDPQRKIRDLQQAEVMLRLLSEWLPQFPMDAGFRPVLPGDLRNHLTPIASPDASAPSW